MFGNRYIDSAVEQLEALKTQLDAAAKAATAIADTVLSGRRVYVYDREHIVDTELVDRGSGLALFRSFDGSDETIGEGDILILAAYEAASEDDMAIASMALSAGAGLVTLAPEGALSGMADIALINSDPDNGVITAAGFEEPFSPVSGIINAALAWSIAAETTAVLISRGKTPSVYRGEYLENGRTLNLEERRRFLSQGY